MALIQLVLFDPSDQCAIRAVEPGLRGLGRTGANADKTVPVWRHCDGPEFPELCDPRRLPAINWNAIKMAFQRRVAKAGEEDFACILNHACQPIDRKVVRGQRYKFFACIRSAGEDLAMTARCFGGQRVHKRGGAEVALQIDPSFVGLSEDIGRITGHTSAFGWHFHRCDVIVGLIAIDPADEQVLAAGAPIAEVNACQILIRCRAPIIAPPVDLSHFARCHISDEQIDNRVRTASAWIALINHRDVFGGDIEAWNDIDRAFIDFGIGEEAVVWAPPIAGIAVHFLLSDELRDAVCDCIAWIAERG